MEGFELTNEECEGFSRAYDARLAYEENCLRKYDRVGKPSLPIPIGERLEDYALKYRTTPEAMRQILPTVEAELDRRMK